MRGWTMATGGAMTMQGQAALSAALAARAMAKNWTRERTDQVAARAEALVVARSPQVDDAHTLAECILAADFETAHGGSVIPPRQGDALWADDEGA